MSPTATTMNGVPAALPRAVTRCRAERHTAAARRIDGAQIDLIGASVGRCTTHDQAEQNGGTVRVPFDLRSY